MVQFCSVARSCPTLCDPMDAARQASLSITNSQSLLKLMSIESVMPSNHLILCHPLLLRPPIFPGIRVLSNESALRIRWPKYWSFSFNISLSNEYSELISFRIDWLSGCLWYIYGLYVTSLIPEVSQQFYVSLGAVNFNLQYSL